MPKALHPTLADEPAIEKATDLGGIGLHVAWDFAGKTQAVREWIIV